MKFFSKLTLTALVAAPLLAQDSLQGQPPQRELGVVRGTIRAETGELITSAELTLSVEPPPSLVDSFKSIASSMGVPPGEVQAVLAEMMRQTPEFIERQLAQIKATGNGPAALVDFFSQALAVKTSAKGFPLRAISDGNGEFTFTGVPPGTFTLLAHRDGYFGVGASKAPHGDHTDASLSVTARSLVTTVTVPMIPGAVIIGHLRDATGRTVPKVPVNAMVIGYRNGMRFVASVRSAQTDDTGQFRLFWLTPGQYFLAAAPAANTGALTTFYPGSVEPTTGNVITVSTGQDLAGMDFSLQSGRTVTISGDVAEVEGSPASPRNLTVTLVRQPGIGREPITGTFPVVEGRKTAFELRGVPPGTYSLYANTTWNLRSATLVDVFDRDVSGIQIALHLNVTVPGVVTLDGEAPRVNGLVRFSPFDPDGKTAIDDLSRPRDPRQREGVPIAPDGKFSAADNPWGRYAIRIIGLSPDSYIDEVQQGGVNVYDGGINLTTDAFRYPTDQITVKVKSNGGRIEGVVQTSDRKPLSRAVVVLVPPVVRRRNPSLYLVTTSDADGRFSLRGIQPGEYKLFAWESVPEGAWQNAEFLAPYESQGRAVSVQPSISTQVEVVAARP